MNRAAGSMVVVLLPDDLLAKVPRQYHHVVGLVLDKYARIATRRPTPGMYLPCLWTFLSTTYSSVRLVKPEIVKHDRTLGGGAVSSDPLSASLRCQSACGPPSGRSRNTTRRTSIERILVEHRRLLLGKDCSYRLRDDFLSSGDRAEASRHVSADGARR